MKTDVFSLREQEIFDTLQALKSCSFVVIGGYAVNSYTLPRFSVDCDMVVQDEWVLKRLENILLSRNYRKETFPHQLQYSGNFLRYEKKIQNDFFVSIDVLVKKVVDRATGAVFEADWIFKHSTIVMLKGKTISEELRQRIITLDALLVMKIISCRATDIRDVFMILPNAQNKEFIQSEVERRYDFKESITKIFEKVASKQFKDGLSGVYGYFDQKTFEKHLKTVRGFSGIQIE